ncbi:hypothetical protein GCM10017688_17010 [Streptomyces ramulosus]
MLSVTGRSRDGSADATTSVVTPPGAGTHGLPDLDLVSTNGWGPVERNTSHGEDAAGDGRPMSIADSAYAEGLGAHAVTSPSTWVGHAVASRRPPAWTTGRAAVAR